MIRNWSDQNPNPALKPKRKIIKKQIDIIQKEHRVNRAGGSFPKGGLSATQTKLKQPVDT